jgi:hypothetical protein
LNNFINAAFKLPWKSKTYKIKRFKLNCSVEGPTDMTQILAFSPSSLTRACPNLKPWTRFADSVHQTTTAGRLAPTHTRFLLAAKDTRLQSHFPTLTTASDIVASHATDFEPILPSSATLVAFFAIVIISVAAAQVWANDVVPAKRRELAISKSRGEVKGYLDELREADEAQDDTTEGITEGERSPVKEDRKFERWLFSDWLNNDKNTRKPAAIPLLKKAKWNSGDNPVLVASGMIMLCVLIASVTERVTTAL